MNRRQVMFGKITFYVALVGVICDVWYLAPDHRRIAGVIAVVCMGLAWGAGYWVRTYEGTR